MIKGIGIDAVEIDRIRNLLEIYGNRFISKILTRGEIDSLEEKNDSILFLAGRFAAKEALFKALGTGWSGGLKWHDIEVLNLKSGCPHIHLSAKTERIFKKTGAESIYCSITHTTQSAHAVVVLE